MISASASASLSFVPSPGRSNTWNRPQTVTVRVDSDSDFSADPADSPRSDTGERQSILLHRAAGTKPTTPQLIANVEVTVLPSPL